MTIVSLPLEDLKTNPKQSDIDFSSPENTERVERIARSINLVLPNGDKYGIREPLEVFQNGDTDTYTINKGEYRFRAAAQAGLTEVPCLVVDSDELIREYDFTSSNTLRRQVPLYELAASVKYHKEKGFNTDDIIILHGLKNGSYVSKLMAIFKLPKAGIELVKKEFIQDANNIYDLKALGLENVKLALERCEAGESAPAVIKELLQLQKKQAKPSAPKPYRASFSFTEDQCNLLAKKLGINPDLADFKEVFLAKLEELLEEEAPTAKQEKESTSDSTEYYQKAEIEVDHA
ncbi:ParB/RepB/Spo0J family partition protein [Candidatus Sororendozoicomonas aggregata]|uniref:ParB/RepB/Spo0J family partition protein n=1 Tax=Candidatus Sororendozoicomonas aggregata TaxID=3073239 RepID=UPI002ED27F3F